jgi:uncharacterized protein
LPTVLEEIGFSGHGMVKATHPTTIEITTDEYLTPRGDCVLGVSADKALAQLGSRTKEALTSDGSRVTLTILSPGGEFRLTAAGSRLLPLDSENAIVIRRSEFVCGRTLAIRADAAAMDIPRDIVRSLASPRSRGTLRIEVST